MHDRVAFQSVTVKIMAHRSVQGIGVYSEIPRPVARVTDLLTGEVLARDANSFTLSFATPDTRLFTLDR